MKIGDKVATTTDINPTDYITIPVGSIGEVKDIRPGAVRVLFLPRHTRGLQWCPIAQIAELSLAEQDDASAEAYFATNPEIWKKVITS